MMPLETVYVLVKKGVYWHEILGVAETKERGEEMAKAAAELESDGYHTIDVLECRVDELILDGELVVSYQQDRWRGIVRTDPR